MAAQMLSFDSAKVHFLKLLDRVNPEEMATFLSWIQDSFDVSEPNVGGPSDTGEADATIQMIAADLRSKLPVTAIFDSERTFWPEYGLDSDCKPESTVHVDSFLYDDDEVDQFGLARNYCLRCGSHCTAPLTFISHSLSISQLRYVFIHLLPSNLLDGKILLDVGSRLGPILFAAHLYSPRAKALVGIEMNEDLCRVQREIAEKYEMTDNISVIHDDLRSRQQEVSSADFLVLNNVFQFFLALEDQKLCWEFLKQFVRIGTIIVSNPSLTQVTQHLELSFQIQNWVEEIPTKQLAAKFSGTNEELFEDCSKICMYQVK